MKPKIYLSNRFEPGIIGYLSEYCEVDVYQGDGAPSPEEVLAHLGGKDGYIGLIAVKIGKDIIDAAPPSLKVISTASAGYNHIEVTEATKKGIYVCNAADGPTEATADIAFALLLSVARRVVEADKYLRRDEWKIVTPMIFFGAPVHGKTLGIIGFGRIGRAVAKRASGFDMKVLYSDVARAAPEVEKALNARFVTMEELLKESDFVSIHTPVSDATHHLIDARALDLMKPTAILINTSRGVMVDEKALAAVLREKKIAGAGLDVYEKEPTGKSNPLCDFDNVVLLPHIGSSTEETRVKTTRIAAENLISVLKGERPAGLLNKEVENIRPLSKIKMIF